MFQRGRRRTKIGVDLISFQATMAIVKECKAMKQWPQRWTLKHFHDSFVGRDLTQRAHDGKNPFHRRPWSIDFGIFPFFRRSTVFNTTWNLWIRSKNQITSNTGVRCKVWRGAIEQAAKSWTQPWHLNKPVVLVTSRSWSPVGNRKNKGSVTVNRQPTQNSLTNNQ